MNSVLSGFEQIARGICVFCHFGLFAYFLITEAILRPFLPNFEGFFNYWFTHHNLRNFGEYLYKQFSIGLFSLLGIRIITEYKVANDSFMIIIDLFPHKLP